jgi:ferric-dicitrate binding protein FerR (iron transport regulator)
MDAHAHITSLVRKLLDDNLSSAELHELQQLFKSPEVQGDVDLWLSGLWKATGSKDIPDAKQIAEQLRRKALNPVKQDNDRVIRTVRSIMRYAAVFVLAMAISWYWLRNDESADTNPVVAATADGFNEISVMYGSKTRIVLPDSSVVYLNSGSKLHYPPVFGQVRNVSLTGEGYFVVRSDSLHPFIVHTSDVSVKALGTEFNVKAYPEENRVETLLIKGSVEILKKDQVKSITGLKPGEKATYIKPGSQKQPASPAAKNAPDSPRMYINIESKPDVSTGWVNNQLVFDAESFEEIAVSLERWFNVNIDIRNAGLRKVKLSGRFDTENIEQVMRSWQLTTFFSYQIDKNRIIIK